MQTNSCNNEITVVLCQRAGKAKKKKREKRVRLGRMEVQSMLEMGQKHTC